jgi:3D (Asp-Asp-Asp) domain-containing protein
MVDVVYGGVVRTPPLHSPKVSDLMQTVTIFAYGVTSSGKTHTMQGTKTDPGVIPRVVRVSISLFFPLSSSLHTL